MANTNVNKFKEVQKLGFNEDETNALVEGLRAQEIKIDGVEDLARYIKEQGVIVKEHIGRMRNYVQISPKVFGIDLGTKSDVANNFFKQHMNMGRIRFIPESYEKRLTNIEAYVRTQRRRLSIGYDSSFLLLDTYKTFSQTVKEKEKEYLDLRDEIVSKWDTLLTSFKTELMDTLKELNSIDVDDVYQSVIRQVPDKQAYKDSFYLRLNVKAFPVAESLTMFSPEMQLDIHEGLNEEALTMLYQVIGLTLNDAFSLVNRVIVSGQNATGTSLPKKTFGAMRKVVTRLEQKNIFHNEKVNEIKRSIDALSAYTNEVDVLVEEGELVLAQIYGYAKELNVHQYIEFKGAVLNESELSYMYNTFFKKEEIVF